MGDIEAIKEDMADPEQSMLFDYFRDTLSVKEEAYNIVKAILDGTKYKSSAVEVVKEAEPVEPVEEKVEAQTVSQLAKPTPVGSSKSSHKSKRAVVEQDETKDPEELWARQRADEFRGLIQKDTKSEDGTEILNAGLIVIPDEVITRSVLLESIDGITHVLLYNNAMMHPPRLDNTYIEFWDSFLDEEERTFDGIRGDIKLNEGPTFDYLMENPPNDRILPVLEKVVDQLKHPMLFADATKKKRDENFNEQFASDIKLFFEEQLSKYYEETNGLSKDVLAACVLFKKNTNDLNFNKFELLINFIDIYDRLIAENPKLEQEEEAG